MKKVLITSFDAFGQDCLNASFELMKILPNQLGIKKIDKLQIPTVRYKSVQVIQDYLQNKYYDYIICLGQAAGTEHIRLEKVAINLDDFRIKDNEGNQPIDEKIILEGENAYFSRLPLKKILRRLSDENIPAQISYTAGTFVCNHVMYSLLHYREEKVGFIHVPQIKTDKVKGLELVEMKKAMLIILETIDQEEDVTIGGNLD